MKYIYNLPLPEAAATNESDSLGQQLSEAGILDDDSAVVESVGSQAADLTLEGQYRWGADISTMLATELDELADSSLPTLPLYRLEEADRYPNRGYYEVQSADVDPLHANDRSVWTYTLNLTYVGAGDHVRSVETTPRQADHEFGTGTQAVVGVPAEAAKVRWLDRATGAYEPAEPIGTCEGSNANVDRYDLADGQDALGVDAPTLVYDVPYEADVRAGVRAYDSRGNGTKLSDGGVRQWQTIHTTEHDLDDPITLSNGCLRVLLDEAADDPALQIVPEEWDAGAEEWSLIADVPIAAGNTDWELYDIDLTSIGMVDVRAQLEFLHPDQGLFDLDVSLQRGLESLLVEWAGETGPIPTGLADWLEPIASTSIADPQPAKGLVSRSEVRR